MRHSTEISEPRAARRRRKGSGTHARTVVATVLAAVLLPAAVGGCGGRGQGAEAQPTAVPADRDSGSAHRRSTAFALDDVTRPGPAQPLRPGTHGVRLLRADVRGSLPHDPRAFTQGLEFHGGTLYESTGLFRRSSLRAGPPGKPPTAYAELPATLFGEGITLSGGRLWHITWRNGIAIERDPVTLAERRRVTYEGEGWGLCHQQVAGRERLVMSDGTDRLTFRDPDTFEATGGIDVHQDGRPVTRLNELECTPDGSVYANAYPTDTIVRIDPHTGAVTAHIDATGLLTPSERRGAQSLNGIAAVPGTDRFLLTGKLWPRMFLVSFVPK
ncbi:glutaminyl-peptide cyclotransferase [Streptomyces sp. NPDC051211]|uniref:glutaminyl-peptide cyclotransferase n=1 Tax=Streptomyces sp. NPDC051211 TaxID=3154643 RepID=UPI00344E58EC